MNRTVVAFEFNDLGTDHAQYFPGVRYAHTSWDEIFLGVGDTAREAAESALESLCQTVDFSTDDRTLVTMDDALIDWDGDTSAHADCTHAGECDDQHGILNGCQCHDECERNHDECERNHYVALYVRYQDEVIDYA